MKQYEDDDGAKSPMHTLHTPAVIHLLPATGDRHIFHRKLDDRERQNEFTKRQINFNYLFHHATKGTTELARGLPRRYLRSRRCQMGFINVFYQYEMSTHNIPWQGWRRRPRTDTLTTEYVYRQNGRYICVILSISLLGACDYY
jgi:hypothetical protein